jgi:phosphoglycolate phosphatase-like HAD superfamily hydrolase
VIRLALDIDGTLLTSEQGAACAGPSGTTGFDADDQPFDFAGKTDLEILRTLLDRAGIPEPDAELRGRFWRSYLSILDRELTRMDGGSLCLGVADLLERLREDPEFRIGLVTGNIEEAAHRKLSCFGIDSYFEFGAYGSDDADRNRLVPLARARAEALEGCEIRLEACIDRRHAARYPVCARG